MRVKKIDLPEDCSCRCMFTTDILHIHKIVVEHDTNILYILERIETGHRACSPEPPYLNDEKVKEFIAPLPDNQGRDILNFLSIVIKDFLS